MKNNPANRKGGWQGRMLLHNALTLLTTAALRKRLRGNGPKRTKCLAYSILLERRLVA